MPGSGHQPPGSDTIRKLMLPILVAIGVLVYAIVYIVLEGMGVRDRTAPQFALGTGVLLASVVGLVAWFRGFFPNLPSALAVLIGFGVASIVYAVVTGMGIGERAAVPFSIGSGLLAGSVAAVIAWLGGASPALIVPIVLAAGIGLDAVVYAFLFGMGNRSDTAGSVAFVGALVATVVTALVVWLHTRPRLAE